MKNHSLPLLLSLVTLGSAAVAAPISFDFKDPKGVNNVVFKLDAPLESINGTSTGISGTVQFDPQSPDSLKGKINLTTKSLTVGNSMMKEHMDGAEWMDVAKHPEITFEVISVKEVKTQGNVSNAKVEGKMTIKGITHPVVVPVKITYLKDRLKDRMPNMKGDLLVLRSDFAVKRSDYGIKPGQFTDKVSEEINLSLSLAGYAVR